MEWLEKMPKYVEKSLENHQIAADKVKLMAGSDLTMDGRFGETWVVINDEMLIVLSGYSKSTGKSRNRLFGENVNKEENTVWEEESFIIYAMQEVEKLNTENLATGGMLVLKTKTGETTIGRYSSTHVRKFGLLAELTNKIIEGKTLSEEDLRDEHNQAYCPKCGLLYPDPTRRICPKCMDKRAIFLRVMSYLPRYKVQISLILLCMLLNAGLNLLNPYLGGRVIFDQVLKSGGKYQGKLLQVVLIMLLIRFLALMVGIAYGRINSGVSAKIVYDLKTEVFTAMQRLSLSFYSSKQTGTLMNRVNEDATHLQYFFHDGFPYFIVNIFTIIGIAVTMVSINGFLALLVFIPVPFIIYFFDVMFPRLWAMNSRLFRRRSALNSMINDALTGMRVVKAFGKEGSEINRFVKANKALSSVDLSNAKLIATTFPLAGFIMGIGGIVVWAVGGWEVVNGNMTFGTLMTFTGYLGMIYGPLDFMTNIVKWWADCMNSASRIFEIIDAVPEVTEKPNPVKIDKIKGAVKFDQVMFSYEPNKPVLNDINIDIKPGEMIGIVGHSGAGKSTIANLITRLYDVVEGQISIDGVNIKDIRVKDLRDQIGLVLQETYLFMGSVYDNIAYAKPDATREEVIRAAEIAHAHDFIIKMPDGYDSIIGNRGQKLSGGEKQRIAIARAILHDPRILILDEATASLDTQTEMNIQEALETLVKGRTTFAIAHRLSTLRNADRLLVVEKGKIIEFGTHSELINKKGAYFKFLQKQSEALKLQGVGE